MKTILAILALAGSLLAQTPIVPPLPNPAPTPGTTTSFSVTLNQVTLPGGKSSVIGTETGVAFTVTPNFDIKELNLIGSGLSFYGGGVTYRLPVISTALNNASTNINGLAFQFALEGELGSVATPTSGTTHWGEMVGGSVSYFLNNTWSLGADIQYAHFPGLSPTSSNTYVVALGPKIHF